MKLREIKVKNFRSLVDVTIPIDDVTVFIGENNSGKTALLDALNIALVRRAGGKSFTEYDYHMSTPEDSRENSDGIVIELWFKEDSPDEWPAPLIQALNEVIQTEPVGNKNLIGLRISSVYDENENDIVETTEFLAINGEPLEGGGKRRQNVTNFSRYFRIFYISALRDSNQEFSPRSRYWGKILKELNIPVSVKEMVSEQLAEINRLLFEADPLLDEIHRTLDKARQITDPLSEESASIRPLPIQPWDLMSKSELMIKCPGVDVLLPLSRHGQGIQSLAVIFLIEAYVNISLKRAFEPETEAILTFEEPEAHLHPQAIRALRLFTEETKSQTVISTHSPYFLQDVPFKNIRVFRRKGPVTEVLFVKQHFETQLPETEGLLQLCGMNPSKFEYVPINSTLVMKGRLEEEERRKLLTIYSADTNARRNIGGLFNESKVYLSDEDLSDLDTYAKRIRGEILFARAWLLCEGPSDFIIIRYFAELLRTPLDRWGVSVIDYQNNGSPGSFISLARTFQIPWLMICDNDTQYGSFRNQLGNRGLTEEEIESLVKPLPGDNMDLEMYLIKNGFRTELVNILARRGIPLTKSEGEEGFDEEIAARLGEHKRPYAVEFVEALRAADADGSRVPAFFSNSIEEIISLSS